MVWVSHGWVQKKWKGINLMPWRNQTRALEVVCLMDVSEWWWPHNQSVYMARGIFAKIADGTKPPRWYSSNGGNWEALHKTLRCSTSLLPVNLDLLKIGPLWESHHQSMPKPHSAPWSWSACVWIHPSMLCHSWIMRISGPSSINALTSGWCGLADCPEHRGAASNVAACLNFSKSSKAPSSPNLLWQSGVGAEFRTVASARSSWSIKNCWTCCLFTPGITNDGPMSGIPTTLPWYVSWSKIMRRRCWMGWNNLLILTFDPKKPNKTSKLGPNPMAKIDHDYQTAPNPIGSMYGIYKYIYLQLPYIQTTCR